MRLVFALLLCVLTTSPALVASAGVAFLPGSQDDELLGCFAPPSLEPWPGDPNRAVLACLNFPPLVGTAIVRIDPAQSLVIVPPLFNLPSDLNGTDPNPPANAVIDAVWLESATLAWLTTSGHETVVPYNPTTAQAYGLRFAGGVTRLSVPTDRTIAGSYFRSDGSPVASFLTDFTSGVARVGDRLLVATSNFTSFSPQVNEPGTVLLFDIDFSVSPWAISVASPPYVITSDPNPTELTVLSGGLVAVTNTGLLSFSLPPDGKPGPVGPGSIDILDAQAGRILASIPLGLSNPSYKSLALDPTGSVAVLGSATRRQLYAIDMRGLAQLPDPGVDPKLQRPSCHGLGSGSAGGVPCLPQRVIRGASNPIAIPPAPGLSGSDGFTVQQRFGLSGDFVVTTAFNDGLIAVAPFDPRNLGWPHPLLASRFGAATSLVATAPIEQSSSEYGPGPLVLRQSPGGALDGTDAVWLSLGPDGLIMRGTLSEPNAPPPPTGDADADTIEDALDNCPLEPNPGQANAGGLGPGASDAIGDVCQCGDVDDDGELLDDDLDLLRDWLSGYVPSLPAQAKCNVRGAAGAGDCNLLDLVVLTRALASYEPGVSHLCAPFLP